MKAEKFNAAELERRPLGFAIVLGVLVALVLALGLSACWRMLAPGTTIHQTAVTTMIQNCDPGADCVAIAAPAAGAEAARPRATSPDPVDAGAIMMMSAGLLMGAIAIFSWGQSMRDC